MRLASEMIQRHFLLFIENKYLKRLIEAFPTIMITLEMRVIFSLPLREAWKPKWTEKYGASAHLHRTRLVVHWRLCLPRHTTSMQLVLILFDLVCIVLDIRRAAGK